MDTSQAQQTLADMNSGKITWDDNLRAQANNALSGGGGGSSTDLASTQAQILEMYKKANEPAIASLTASIPETQNKFAFERTKLEEQRKPLEQRYQNLLDEITRQQGVQTQAATTQTSQELNARGILGSSPLYNKTVNAAVSPIAAQYTGMTKDIGLERENKLMELTNLIAQTTPQEIESIRAIQNAIATLQSGAGTNAINAALDMVNQAKAREATLEANRIQYQNAKPTYSTLSQGDILIDPTTGKIIGSNPKAATTGGGGIIIQREEKPTTPPSSQLNLQFGGGNVGQSAQLQMPGSWKPF